jgi:hypothetical protein
LWWRFEGGEDGVGESGPGRGLETELGASFGGEGVELCPSIVFGGPPFGGDPSADFEAVEGGVEGSFFYLKDVVGGAFNPASDAVAMGGPPRDGFEDEEVEGPAEDFDGRFGHAATPIGFLGGSIVCDSPRKSMGRGTADWGRRGTGDADRNDAGLAIILRRAERQRSTPKGSLSRHGQFL